MHVVARLLMPLQCKRKSLTPRAILGDISPGRQTPVVFLADISPSLTRTQVFTAQSVF